MLMRRIVQPTVLGDKLYVARRAKNWSLKQVARQTSFSPEVYHQLETGRKTYLNAVLALELSLALELPLFDICLAAKMTAMQASVDKARAQFHN